MTAHAFLALLRAATLWHPSVPATSAVVAATRQAAVSGPYKTDWEEQTRAELARELIVVEELAARTEELGSAWEAARSFWPPDRSPGIAPKRPPGSTEPLEPPASGVPGPSGGSQAHTDKIATTGEIS